MISDEIVYLDSDFVIIKATRLFGSGFNCYKSLISGKNKFRKINPENSYFISFDSAKNWLDEYRNRYDRLSGPIAKEKDRRRH